ncbi:MAG TPA: M28 family peptidase [Candidatus Limnocylindrales bacterium]|nr:M28 family peptidase [Candidatus Limnocylindrales bacterium]
MNAYRLYFLPLLALCFFCAACEQNHTASAAPSAPAESPASGVSASPAKDATPVGPQLHIDANRAMQYVKEIVAFGPRWDGSPGQQKLGSYLHNKLKADGAEVEDDAFTQQTPAEAIPMRNIIAKFPGSKDGVIVMGSHIDTNYPLRNTKFVGANDGGSSTALLLAIGDQLRGRKLDGYSVWLAFLDGEESIPSERPGDLRWDDNQSLYGSRHLAQKWQQNGTIKKVKAFILADMIGDKDLEILRDQNSTPWLLDLVAQASRSLGYQSYFFAQNSGVIDDHVPFQKAGAPVADIIDLDYGFNNAFHHTTEDTIDKLSAKSLQITGDVILETIRLINGR